MSPSLPTHASPQTAPHKDPPLESLNFFGSARQTFQSPATFSFDYNLPASHFQFDTTTAAHEDPASGSLDLFTANVAPANTGPESQGNFDDLRPFLRDIGQPPMSLFAGTPEGATTSTAQLLTGQSEATAHVPVAMSSGKPGQIEDIASWGDISFLISLHVRYQHALVPLCHQPSLARDILHRRDQKDEAFRCFLLSVGGSSNRASIGQADSSLIHVNTMGSAIPNIQYLSVPSAVSARTHGSRNIGGAA